VGLTRARPRTHSSRRLWLAGIVVLGAVAFLVVRGLGNSIVYFKTADEAVASRAQLGSRDFRIEGVVVPGSVRPSGTDVDFAIASKGVQVPVINQGSPPQLFQPNIPVVLEGHFAGQRFMSDQIMVKHSAVYVAQHPSRVTAPDGSTR
jgi:cytochrome c-type biogenesis protein CcmE